MCNIAIAKLYHIYITANYMLYFLQILTLEAVFRCNFTFFHNLLHFLINIFAIVFYNH